MIMIFLMHVIKLSKEVRQWCPRQYQRYITLLLFIYIHILYHACMSSSSSHNKHSCIYIERSIATPGTRAIRCYKYLYETKFLFGHRTFISNVRALVCCVPVRLALHITLYTCLMVSAMVSVRCAKCGWMWRWDTFAISFAATRKNTHTHVRYRYREKKSIRIIMRSMHSNHMSVFCLVMLVAGVYHFSPLDNSFI